MHGESNPAKGQDVRRTRDKPESGRAVVEKGESESDRAVAGKGASRQRGRLFARWGARRARKTTGCSPDFRREVLLVASLTGRTAPGFTTRVQLLAKMATVCHFLENLNESGSEIGEAEWP